MILILGRGVLRPTTQSLGDRAQVYRSAEQYQWVTAGTCDGFWRQVFDESPAITVSR